MDKILNILHKVIMSSLILYGFLMGFNFIIGALCMFDYLIHKRKNQLAFSILNFVSVFLLLFFNVMPV
jgi:hypothetical protein